MSKGFISTEEAIYIELLLRDADLENKKNGLQRICKLYQSEKSFQHPHSVRQTLNGLLYCPSPKIVRWTLNAIALCGRRTDNLPAILDALTRYERDIEVTVAGVAALFSLCTSEEVGKLLIERKLPLEGPLLIASAQFSRELQTRLSKDRIDIFKSTPLELRMGMLLVGLNRAPEHLFDEKHENKAVIGVLNGHDDSLVAQYSVWATAENPKLGLSDLRLKLKDIETLPANVRGWVYRLIAADNATASKNSEYIVVGSEDPDKEAREGLAISLRNVFFDGLDETVYSWLPDEAEVQIRNRLLEHMAANVPRCPSYETPVTEVYRNSGHMLRTRLEVAAQRSKLYATLRRIAIIAEQTTFDLMQPRETHVVVNQNINTGGGSIGSVTGQGNVFAETIQAIGTMKSNDDLKGILEQLIRATEKSGLPPEKQTEGAMLVRIAASEPTKSNLQKLGGWLKLAIETGVLSAEAVRLYPHLLQALQRFM